MKFEEALAAMREGKKVQREGERDCWYYSMMTTDEGVDTLLTVYRNSNVGGVAFTSRELLAEDWKLFEGWDE